MVNTFITFLRKSATSGYVPDYSRSAKALDIRRSLKQCVEGMQIVNILEAIDHVCKQKGWEGIEQVSSDEYLLPIPEQAQNYLRRVEQYKDLRKRYLDSDIRYVIIDGEEQTRTKDDLPLQLKKDDRYTINSDGLVTVWVKKTEVKKVKKYAPLVPDGDRYDLSRGGRCRTKKPLLFARRDIALPSDSVYTLGFSQHAICKMWVGYTDSLKAYVNAHIVDYCSRTTSKGTPCTINIPLYDVPPPEDIVHPWWLTMTHAVILSHRASLTRKEPGFYAFNVPTDWVLKHGYVWTGSFDPEKSEELVTCLMSGKRVKMNDICAPIQK